MTAQKLIISLFLSSIVLINLYAADIECEHRVNESANSLVEFEKYSTYQIKYGNKNYVYLSERYKEKFLYFDKKEQEYALEGVDKKPRVFLDIYCRSNGEIKAFPVIDSFKIGACTSRQHGGICVEGVAVVAEKGRVDNNVILTINFKKVARVVFRNFSKVERTVKSKAFRLELMYKSEKEKKKYVYFNNDTIRIAATSKYTPTCQIVASGIIGRNWDEAYNSCYCSSCKCKAPGSVKVDSKDLFFSFGLNDVPRRLRGVNLKKTSWYIDGKKMYSNGIFFKPGNNIRSGLHQIMVRTRTKTNNFITCSLNVDLPTKDYQIELNEAGDCELFAGIRDYYFLNINGKKKISFYSSENLGLSFAGGKADFSLLKSVTPPLKGLNNIAENLEGEIVRDYSGNLVIPESRIFEAMVIVARKFEKQVRDTKRLGKIVGYGLINPLDFKRISFNISLNNSENILSDNDLVVFDAFLARRLFDKSGKNIRGRIDFCQKGKMKNSSICSLWKYLESTKKGKPVDYIVPFWGDSCSPARKINLPKREDGKIAPTVFKNRLLCRYSKSFTGKEFKQGKISLNILKVVPSNADDQYPVSIKTHTKKEVCDLSVANEKEVACWNLPDYIQNSITPGKKGIKVKCRTVKKICNILKICPGNNEICSGGVGYCELDSSYRDDCILAKRRGNECSGMLMLRKEEIYRQMMASLGCVAKYDTILQGVSSVYVAATLKNQGIFPHFPSTELNLSLGGDSPRDFREYKIKPGKKMYGYGCIPCRFGINQNLRMNTGNYLLSRGQPIFRYTKSSLPKSCVKQMTIKIPFWRDSICREENNVSNNICRRLNKQDSRCNGSKHAGSFSVNICNVNRVE